MKNKHYQYLRASELREDRFDDLFRTVFWVTFGLTVVIGPMILARSPGGILLLPFSVLFGFALMIKAVVFAALIYWVTFRPLAMLIPQPIAFVIVAVTAAFASVLLAAIINVDFVPVAIYFDPKGQGLGLVCGSVAAIISFFVSSFLVGSAR